MTANDEAPKANTPTVKANKGKLLMDVAVAPQNITSPTDLKLLNAARIKSEELIYSLYQPGLHGAVKVRTYRQTARKKILNTAKRNTRPTKKYINPMGVNCVI